MTFLAPIRAQPVMDQQFLEMSSTYMDAFDVRL